MAVPSGSDLWSYLHYKRCSAFSWLREKGSNLHFLLQRQLYCHQATSQYFLGWVPLEGFEPPTIRLKVGYATSCVTEANSCRALCSSLYFPLSFPFWCLQGAPFPFAITRVFFFARCSGGRKTRTLVQAVYSGGNQPVECPQTKKAVRGNPWTAKDRYWI